MAEVWAFLRVGRDLALRTGSLLAALTAATAVAAHQILSQLFIFLALAVDALAVAGQAMVGRLRGARDWSVVVELSDRLLAIGLTVGLMLMGVLWLLASTLGSWLTADPGVVSEFESAFWLLAIIQPIAAVVFVWDGVFIGVGDFTSSRCRCRVPRSWQVSFSPWCCHSAGPGRGLVGDRRAPSGATCQSWMAPGGSPFPSASGVR